MIVTLRDERKKDDGTKEVLSPIVRAILALIQGLLMSAFGAKRTFRGRVPMSAFGGKADIDWMSSDVCF